MAIDKSDYRHVFATVFTDAEELLLNAKHHSDTLTQYLQIWRGVVEKAAKLDNPALQDVVLLFVDAADFAFKQTTDAGSLPDAQWQLLKKWHSSFVEYANAPDDQNLALTLIQCLNAPFLAIDLTPEDEKVLLDSFLPVIKQLNADSKQTVTTKEDSNEKLLSAWEKLAVLFQETDVNFQELPTLNSEDSEEDYSEAVKQYLESWKAVVEFIEAEQEQTLAKILDIISLLVEFSCQLFNQTGRLNTEQQAVLTQWHNLFASYIKVNGSQQLASALVRLLTNPVWPQPVSADDEKMLLSEFQEQQNSTPQLSENQQPDVQETIESLSLRSDSPQFFTDTALSSETVGQSINAQDEIAVVAELSAAKELTFWQQLEQLFNETTPYLKAAAEQQSQNDELGLTASLQNYLENWLAIAQQIEIAGEQSGLLDVVLLFIEVSRQTFEQITSFETRHISLLNKWQSLFGSYLKAKGNKQLAVSLIKCLRDLLWQGAIEAEDEEMLLAGFTAGAPLQLTEEKTKSLEESAVTENLASAEQMTIEEVQVIAADETAELSDILAELPEITQLKEAIDVNAEPANAESEEAGFANLEQKNLIWEVLQPEFNQAAEVLKAAIDSEILNDVAAFKLGLQNYIERWQIIADMIGNDESLTALLDVVSLFLEISQQSFAELDSLSSEQFTLLNGWQSNFANFFKTPHQNRFAAGLVKCLGNPLWSEPIAAEDEAMLLEGFGITEPETGLAAAAKQNPLWQKISVFFDDAQAQLWIMLELLAENPPQSCQNYFQQYAEHWLRIAEIIAEEDDDGLHILADIVFLFADNCTELLEQHSAFSSSHIQLLQAWHIAFVACLDDITNTQKTKTLIACLENNLWLSPLTGNDKEMLLSMQAEQNQYQSISVAEGENLLLFNQGMFSEDEVQDFGLFAEEDYEEPVILTESEELPAEQESEEAALFADEEEADLNEDFSLFAEEDYEEPVVLTESEELPAEQESEEAALFADEEEADLNEDFSLFAEEDYEEPVVLTESEELPAVQEPEEIALFADEETDINEDFSLFAEDMEFSETALTTTAEESKQVAIPSDEELDASSQVENLQLQAEEAVVFAETLAIADEDVADETTAAVLVNPELIGMVRDEFDLLVKEFNLEINTPEGGKPFKDVLKNHVFKLENLAKACNTIGLLGLEQVFELLSFNMRSRRDSDTFTEREAELFEAALPLIQNHIAAITDLDKARALVAHLSLQGWKQPLTEAQTKPLIKLLSGLVLSSHSQQLDNRKTQAELADISLELPEDVNNELLDSLLNELPVLTNNFSAVIQQIISEERELPQLLEAQRIAHTLKGSGNIVGVTGIAVLTHHLEEILEHLSKHETFPTKALAKVLLESADCLEMMSELMLNGEHEPPEQALQVLQNVLNWANQIAGAGLPAEDSEVETTTLPALPDTGITPIVREAKTLEAIAMTRVPSEKIDQLLRMTGEGSILNEQFKERIKRFSEELKVLNDLTWHIQSLVSELDQSINIQSYNSKSSRSNIDSEFDALEMEQYNELHTAASRIAEAATDIREINIHMDQQLVDLKYLMMEEDTIQKENQEMVQSIRMVPASTISSRCQRIVRQACRATNKEVELEIKGADILIDSEILNDMVDPLMHLLRNSIDHGIEPLHIREKFNKPKVGKITLEFSRKGNYAVITCKDDGGGLASGNILQTAIKKGLISAKQQLTEAEIHKLILIPGFSTRAVVTQTSGRGIGMDAIQTKISSIQGQMSLFSVRNEGLAIEITIPLTLSSMLSLLIKCGGQTMAISNRGLRKIHHADECTVAQEDGHLYCDIDYKRYPAKHFAELVGMPITYEAEQKLQGLRIEDEIGRTHIVFVEELLGYRDLLVKDMGSYIPHIQGITGASILGNGDVAPVIDLVEMLHHAAKYDYVLADASKALADSINGLPVALVVDDSLSARRAVAMLLKDSGLEVETAIDGLDAIKQIEKIIPDIILVDLEMPRMNGIELTAHVRNRDDMKDVPIIMITSRATEKHRKQAEAAGVTKFMTKPFTEDELLNNVRRLMKS